MRKLLIIIGAGLMACAVCASESFTVALSMGTNTAASVTFPRAIAGAVDAIHVVCVTNGVLKADEEAVVGLSYALHHGASSATLVTTNTVSSGEAAWRPRVIGTTIAGVDLAAASITAAVGEGTNAVATAVLSIPYEPITLTGETVTMSVSGSTTGVTWRAVIITK
jgi:hypothetical protein